MTFLAHILRTHKQLLVLLLWIAFIGWTVWLHAQQSQQPPTNDAPSYFLKAYNFWSQVDQHKAFNPLNVEPTFRPPGTILMSYPFGFDMDYRGFYFRSVFFPILLLNLAVLIIGYQRDLDTKQKWYLVLSSVFFSTIPSFYHFENSSELQSPHSWGHVDNFLAGFAAIATAATVRSVWTRSLFWLVWAAALSSFCLLIKPAGSIIMALTGITWFGLTALKLKLAWKHPIERKSTMSWILRGMIIFAVVYSAVLFGSMTSNYLSSDNLVYGGKAVKIMRTESQLTSWSSFLSLIKIGPGNFIVGWLLLMTILVVHYLWRSKENTVPWSKYMLIGTVFASFFTLIFGIYFWLYGSGGGLYVRYFIPFALMAEVLVLPAVLAMVLEMRGWKITMLSIYMVFPIVNLSLLLPQQDVNIDWQKWTGINLTSGVSDPISNQAKNFVNLVKKDGRNVTLYEMSVNTDIHATFLSNLQYETFAKSQIPSIAVTSPHDWMRSAAYRKKEIVEADYWIFAPVRGLPALDSILAKSSIEDLREEKLLFEAWATQLTTKEGVTVVSDTSTARVLRITDATRLESAFDTLVAKHHWRSVFLTENPKSYFSEKELASELTLNPPSLENVNFGNLFHLRAFSVNRAGDDVTVRFWWRPLSPPLVEKDWYLFIHSIDDEGKGISNNSVSLHFFHPLSSSNDEFLLNQITIKNPDGNGVHQLGIGFYRPNQTPLIADKGTRDWDNHRVIIPLP